ncbi:MAG: ATP-binding protein [Solirubrobacteraceae bacterium]
MSDTAESPEPDPPRRARAVLHALTHPLAGSIRNQLALLFFLITLIAISGVYVYVTPSLETSLRRQKLAALQTTATAALAPLARTVGTTIDAAGVDRAVRDAADRAGAHIALLGISTGSAGVYAYPITESGAPADRASSDRLPLAMRAAARGRTVTATVHDSHTPTGEVALPIFFAGRVARVAVFSVPLGDVQTTVGLIRRKVLIAGLVALGFALLAGTLVARALSLRVKRLERAARRVARGDFSGRFRVDSSDELGQLAAALDEMQQQLQELDTARKRFIAIASHELRTPIFSLGGFLELIQDEELDEETRRQFVGQVRQQVDRLGKLATGLLDLSRLEAGSVELDPSPTDLGVLARAVTSEFIPALHQHDSRLELRLARDPVSADCDPERVAQVLRILIDNAILHTPRGTAIVVTVARGAQGHGASLAVMDRGPGIPAGSAERIFDPFFTSDGVQGSGLGLAIARELAERMRARLQVESRPGATTFALRLEG